MKSVFNSLLLLSLIACSFSLLKKKKKCTNEFTCPKGQKRVDNNLEKTVNGCGAQSNSKFMEIINKIGNTIGKRFIECCNKHDICYGTCGTTHKGCDDSFKECMQKECKPLNIAKKALCKTTAFGFHKAVAIGGKCVFYKTQEEHCRCE